MEIDGKQGWPVGTVQAYRPLLPDRKVIEMPKGMTDRTSGWLVGIDIGGTFTDVVAISGQEMRTAKVASRPDAPAAAISDGIAAVGLTVKDIVNVIHGTTRVTNAIVEDKLPPVALLATQGFSDSIEIGRLRRHDLYRLDVPPKRPPLVPAQRRFGVDERMSVRGEVSRPLDERAIEQAVDDVRRSGARSVAVCLLHAYINPEHERALAIALRNVVPHISLSHRVNPEAREFERASSTVLNAAAMPVAVDYIDEILSGSALDGRFQLFHSAGGYASPDVARERPLILALSGPAAGVAGTAALARAMGEETLLTFDMGGTTTDVCLVRDGRIEVTSGRSIGGRPVRQPMAAVETIGAGGGSIVRLTPGGLTVAPDSAGATPGPACYGMGGTEPTVTDANAVLGLLDPETRLGGTITLDIERARQSLAPIAQALGRSVTETALGVHRIANAAMARALRRVTVERGIDGRRCTLLAFGGAGPMHATGLAREVGIARIIVPTASSAFSAYGCLLSDMSYTQQRTVRLHSATFDTGIFEQARAEMQEELSRPLLDQGSESTDIAVEYVGLARYDGQSEAIAVPFSLPFDHGRFAADFNRRHHEIFGYAMDEPWVLEGLRITASRPSGITLRSNDDDRDGGEPVAVSHRECHFDASGPIRTPCLARQGLAPGREVVGPAIIVDAWSTTVVPPGWAIESDSYGNLVMSGTAP